MQNLVLPFNKKIRNHLELKVPKAKQASADTLLDDMVEKIHPIKFEAIDEESLR